MSPLAWFLVLLVQAYQLFIRPVIGNNCRFEPHCSAYAIEALRTHGAMRGTCLAVWRVLRCNPWCMGGHDPVPPSDDCRRGHATPFGKGL